MVHETLKNIGYNRLISDGDLRTYQMWYYSPDKEYLNIPLGLKIDSLVISYPEFEKSSKFYKEFWKRGVAEQNDKAVFKVLTEVREILINKIKLPVDNKIVNDTLFTLATFDLDTVTNVKIATDYFNYLYTIGLHQSAYNLLKESCRFQDLQIDKEELIKKLTKTKQPINIEPWIMDDTK